MEPEACQSLLREDGTGDCQLSLAQFSGPSPDLCVLKSKPGPVGLLYVCPLTQLCAHLQRVTACSFCGADPLCSAESLTALGRGVPRPVIILNQGLIKGWKGDLSGFGSHMVSVTITQFCSPSSKTVREDS